MGFDKMDSRVMFYTHIVLADLWNILKFYLFFTYMNSIQCYMSKPKKMSIFFHFQFHIVCELNSWIVACWKQLSHCISFFVNSNEKKWLSKQCFILSFVATIQLFTNNEPQYQYGLLSYKNLEISHSKFCFSHKSIFNKIWMKTTIFSNIENFWYLFRGTTDFRRRISFIK